MCTINHLDEVGLLVRKGPEIEVRQTLLNQCTCNESLNWCILETLMGKGLECTLFATLFNAMKILQLGR